VALDIEHLRKRFENSPPPDLLQWALDQFGEKLVLVTSFQKEGMVLIDMVSRLRRPFRVATIDTGRLHEETYEFMDRVRKHYGLRLEVYFPDAEAVRKMVSMHGNNLFYYSVEARLQCCRVRKVEPLVRILDSARAWISGLRAEQWVTRRNVRQIELDAEHGGILKLNPLARWSDRQVEEYIRRHQVPIHPLYAKGYTSIGCAPCTRPVREGEHPRAGRWWWENGARKECGMHCSL